MIFARKVWHLLVAIKDGLVLVFMLLFFVVLFGALTARPSAGLVREGALLLKLDGVVVEEPAAADPLALLFAETEPMKEHRARDVARALRAAATDDRIKAVALDLSRFAERRAGPHAGNWRGDGYGARRKEARADLCRGLC